MHGQTRGTINEGILRAAIKIVAVSWLVVAYIRPVVFDDHTSAVWGLVARVGQGLFLATCGTVAILLLAGIVWRYIRIVAGLLFFTLCGVLSLYGSQIPFMIFSAIISILGVVLAITALHPSG